ncbi:MAG: redoxin domain-containing protein [Gemmatimonadaceae bacterium]|nr:redoxin domain-containing protein [Chitinophagaceae bacterium]
MKSLLFFSLLVAAFTIKADTLPIGADMPKKDVKIKDVSGKIVTLKEAMSANGLLVMFSCNTCPYVIKNQQRTNDICKYAQSRNMGVVILNSNEGNRSSSESLIEMQEYAKAQGYHWLYAVDSGNEIADAFGANRTPECFLFDKNAKLVYHGAIDDNPADQSSVQRNHLKEAMTELTSGKDVSVKQSRSVGCAIKRD